MKARHHLFRTTSGILATIFAICVPEAAAQQPPRDPEAEQVPLEPAGEMAAVLQRPGPLIEPLTGPAQQFEMPCRRGPHRALGELAAMLVDGHDGMAALVQIGSDGHHVPCLLLAGG